MKKTLQLFVVAMIAATGTSYAQYAGDAIRFGNTNYGSTARFKGMGGAQIGVGGDMSSLGGNPAGLGLFTRSEFSFTPEFNNSTSKADFLGQQTTASQNKMNINHAGIVWYSPSLKVRGQDTKKGLISTVFGIGYNRNNDFNQHYTYEGTNTTTTMRDYFAELANSSKDPSGVIPAKSLEDMAFNGYLINFNTPQNANNYTADPFSDNVQLKDEMVSGSTSEMNFSGAFNISNQFYIGASIGIVNLRYISDAEYVETGVINPYDPTDGFTGNENYKLSFIQSQETKGSGFNGRIGFIFRPVENLRLGATVQTPTWLYIDDSYSEVLNNTLSGKGPFSTNHTVNTDDFSYRLKTPMKGSLGASYVIGGQAIISADVDFVDYSSTRFSSTQGIDSRTIIDNNADVRKLYTSAMNYRVGGEYKIDKLSLRAGFGLNGSPMKNDTDNIYAKKYYSGGFGYRINEYYFDLAYQHATSENRLSSYVLTNGGEPTAAVKNANNNVFLTFGLRF
ncbi:OmpP1/FadL family transporter [Pedobacter frigoris]|uniref:Long-chain fatty acid transport protein n=1 Tax=Pedobacter frigoris TaxID=2571272 RepID=A0A4U1CI41_9SPHI|nr:hypothetical protein [Pedobacter frigoris]TKC06111.1 hypothetical protein FA047_12350 [Pedobacter frigoris]